jgi:4-carboxymuconolactone decarboxylase
MPPSETAQRNHDTLFPGRSSTLAQTDPELVEYFDNFAFDEVLAQRIPISLRQLTRVP